MDKTKIYDSVTTCPVCEQKFPGTKVRVGSHRVASQATDFAIQYEGVNPILYEIFVCPHCGYAAFQNNFDYVKPKDKKLFAAALAPHWRPKSYNGERTLDSALDTFKLALYCLQLRKAKNSEIAKTCLRIAWIYRWKDDPREVDFLKFALDCYTEAFQTEEFPLEKLDEPHCIYLIAELHRKLGDIEEATRWFGRFFNNPAARANRSLMDKARDQYQLIKDLRENQS